MPRILRSKPFWIGAVVGAVAGPYVVKKVTGGLSPISNVTVQR